MYWIWQMHYTRESMMRKGELTRLAGAAIPKSPVYLGLDS